MGSRSARRSSQGDAFCFGLFQGVHPEERIGAGQELMAGAVREIWKRAEDVDAMLAELS